MKISNYLSPRSLRLRKKKRGVSFFGLCPKNETHSPILQVKRAIYLQNGTLKFEILDY
ncbi:MAG: hypothetical protein U5L45_10235 [Saprospiraceae bacterium]|nr:hypothetical protein [Saprospiraceae bacterium]